MPEYSWSGYRCYWEEKSGNTVKRYSPGARYKVTKNTKFCLHRYELYDVKFYSEDGKKEHKDLRKQAIKGENIRHCRQCPIRQQQWDWDGRLQRMLKRIKNREQKLK